VLVLGLTFKEDCADLRNSRVIDVIHELEAYGVAVLVHDPVAEAEAAKHEYGVDLIDLASIAPVDAIVAAVAHQEYLQMSKEVMARLISIEGAPFMDVKSAFDRVALESVGLKVWRL